MSLVKKVFANKRLTKGDVGIELEYEGANLPQTGFEQYWVKTADGSLRGESAEFVLRRPVFLNEVDEALKVLSEAFKENRTKVFKAFRAGTHIHLNMQEFNMVQVINFLTLYFMYENTLLRFCSPERTGNHFCLRAKDAEALITMLFDSVEKGDLAGFFSDHYRYSAVNLTSLSKFGSLEFRSLESTTDWKKLKTWILLHFKLREKALEFKNPSQILLGASAEGFETFTKKVFGDLWEVVKPLYQEQDVQDGVWDIQSVVFSKDWEILNYNIFAKSNIFDVTP